MDDQVNISKESTVSKDDYKYEIPESCLQVLMKGLKIEKLSKKYVLVAHPNPIIEGEMLLFQPQKQDQYDKELIIYRDYSLRKRIPTKIKTKKLSNYMQKKLEEQDNEVTKLQSLEIDLN